MVAFYGAEQYKPGQAFLTPAMTSMQAPPAQPHLPRAEATLVGRHGRRTSGGRTLARTSARHAVSTGIGEGYFVREASQTTVCLFLLLTSLLPLITGPYVPGRIQRHVPGGIYGDDKAGPQDAGGELGED